MPSQPKREPVNWREGRRLRAWELAQQGWKPAAIAQALGVTPGAVSQWLRRARTDGIEALYHRPPPGPASRLTPEQLAKLPARLAQGAPAHGGQGAVWTRPRVVLVIKRHFGVTYHPAHVGRLLKRHGLSLPQPETQATQRDDAAVAQWWDVRWPALKKRPLQTDDPSSG